MARREGIVDTLATAIRAGDILLAAKEKVPPGRWGEWLNAEFAAVEPEYRSLRLSMSHAYMRLASYGTRGLTPTERAEALAQDEMVDEALGRSSSDGLSEGFIRAVADLLPPLADDSEGRWWTSNNAASATL